MKTVFIFLLIILSTSTVMAHGISDGDRQDMIDGGNLQYIELGAEHMLTGYDHLLFLLGVVFFLTKFRDIAKFITAFTIGHSITLIFATFMGISANYYLIDAVIALTVVYKGFDNLDGFRKWFHMKSPNLIFLVFNFGLIHGFGLSTRLQQLPLPEDGLLLRILSFNLGVELGQIAGLAVMLFLLNLWRKSSSFTRFSTAVNVGLVLAGIGLFVFQINGYVSSASGSTSEQVAQWTTTKTITLEAGGWIEYKFGVEKGGVLEYQWKTEGGPLYFDFHGEEYDAKPDEFTSFETATKSESAGSLAAPFTGRAGWYWKNKNTVPVTVILEARGQYSILEGH